ncbi:MAG: aminotransferase class I/II-fold pyridoxal phosphate-dependent enzyme, partial [Oscillospiraceae bacterium]|nr:aminotransferase class I/II-fold pyridoxal phosphate-dependent enzyme [Oscillospiraceae bacterium]
MEAIHGGDWAGYEREYGEKPLDFSANVSPLGMPETARAAAAQSLAEAGRYPDPRCRALREALAARHGVPSEQIVCGAGAADLIWRLPRALGPKSALVFAPGFAEYERALEAQGCKVRRYFPEEARDFSPGEELLTALGPDLDMAFLCQPNNPTGRLIEPELLQRVWERCRQQGTVLVLDECFLDFLPEPERFSLIDRLSQTLDLVLLRAFTKSHAMAGLRLGYALCGSAELAAALDRCGP